LADRLEEARMSLKANKQRQRTLLADRLEQSRQLLVANGSMHLLKPRPMPGGTATMKLSSSSLGTRSTPALGKASMGANDLLQWMTNLVEENPTRRNLAPLEGSGQLRDEAPSRKRSSLTQSLPSERPPAEGEEDDSSEANEDENGFDENSAEGYSPRDEDVSVPPLPKDFGEVIRAMAEAPDDAWLELSPPKVVEKAPEEEGAAPPADHPDSNEDAKPSPVSFDTTDATASAHHSDLDARALQAFHKLAVDFEMPVDRFIQGLKMCGYKKPIVDEETLSARYTASFVTKAEWIAVVRDYAEQHAVHLQKLFDEYDTNRNGCLSDTEISGMLRDLGISPVPGVVQELIREVVASNSSHARVEKKHFEEIHDIIVDRAGFTLREYDELARVFDRYDRDKDGEIDALELQMALLWMGFVTNTTVVSKFFQSSDGDHSGLLNRTEFLNLMRIHREDEIETVLSTFGKHVDDYSGTVGREDLESIFRQLGYMAARPAVIEECLLHLKLAEKQDFVFEDIYLLLGEFRSVEAFLDEEREEIASTFAHHSSSDGLVSGVQLGGAVRWLGYPQTVEQLQQILEDFDVDKNGSIDLQEFTKVARHFKVALIEKIRSIFKGWEANGSGGRLGEKELRQCFMAVGFLPNQDVLDRLLAEQRGAGQDLWKLVAFVEQYLKDERTKLRANYGFNDIEVRKLEKRFSSHDSSGTGVIRQKDLRDLLKSLFAGIQENADTHAKAKAMLAHCDAKGDGLDFREFLHLMREVQDEADQAVLAEEQKAMRACNLSLDEMKEFRQIFNMYDADESGDMSQTEVKCMLLQVIDVGPVPTARLNQMLTAADTNGDSQMNFAEFLWLMKKVREENLGGINQASANIAERDRQQSKTGSAAPGSRRSSRGR